MAKNKYSESDVIWKLGDTRVEKLRGKKVFAGNSYEKLVEAANRGTRATLTFKGIGIKLLEGKGFVVEDSSGNQDLVTFIIPEKEPEMIPLDLSNPEIRRMLRGRWIRKKDGSYEKVISYFSKIPESADHKNEWKCTNLTAGELFKNWEFCETSVNGTRIIGAPSK